MTEHSAIAADLAPDRAAGFQRVLRDQLEGAYRLACAMLRDRVEAQDAVQDALVKAWQHWPSLREPEHAGAWFYRILVNECRERLRRRGREVALAELPERAGPDDLAASAEQDALRAALAGVTADERLVLVLRFYADLTIDDIASRTGSRVGTVKSRLHRAVRALRAVRRRGAGDFGGPEMTQERFERTLREVLAEPATGPVPAALGEWLERLPEAQPVYGRTILGRLFGGRGGGHGRGAAVFAVLGAVTTVAIALALLGGPLLAGLGKGGQGGTGAAPIATPAPSGANEAPRFAWDSGIVLLTIQAGGFTANGQSFLVSPGNVRVRSDAGDEHYQTLELTWQENGVEMRMTIYLAADDRSWWVSELRTYNGAAQGDWLTYMGPLFRTPLGSAYTGDVALRTADGRGTVTFTGVRLQAFAPGRTRQDPIGCKPVVAPGDAQPGPLAQGQPLAGSGIEAMTPPQAAAFLAARSLCVTWRFDYSTGQNTGYSEFWCTAPPEGRIENLAYDSSGNLIVFVGPLDGAVRPVRPQPPLGWGC